MFKRTPKEWKVKLQSKDGQTIVETVKAFWDPKFEGVKESVALAARCQAWVRSKKKVAYQALGEPELVG